MILVCLLLSNPRWQSQIERIDEMEVAGDTCTLVLSARLGSTLVQLIYDKATKGYYLSHRHHGKLVNYEFMSADLAEATVAFHSYRKSVAPDP